MKKILTILVAPIVLTVVALAIAVATFDVNRHRGEIEVALGRQTGRVVKLGGDVHFGLSSKGLTLSIRDVALGNPSWASRPNMAAIGLFDLKVGLLSLLRHRIDINGLAIENADILLEADGSDRRNWDMQVTTEKTTPITSSAAVPRDAATPVVLNVADLSIKNSRIAIRGVDGKTTVFKADIITLGREGGGIGVHFTGSLNDAPIKLALATSADSLTSRTARPVKLDLSFAGYHLTASGTLNAGGSKADLDAYEVTSGDSKISGHLAAAWDGERPAVKGTLTSDRLELADFVSPERNKDVQKPSVPVAAKASAAPTRLFSDQPLDLAALKTADVDLDVAIASMPLGSVELQDIKGKLIVKNGHAYLSPMKMGLGVGSVAGQINLDASAAPARLGITLAAKDVDLGDLIKAGGIEAFLSGKANADLNLVSAGNSEHELASNLSGPINLIGAGGDVVSSTTGKFSSAIAEILSPGSGGNDSMNCVVARFIASQGVVRGNGILIDTVAATAAGYGDIDLRSETLNLDFHAKTKLVDLGGLVPPLRIRGTLAQPDVSADPKAIVQNIEQALTGGSIADGVPDVMTQQGQNACAAALAHPSARASASKGGMVQDLAGKAGNLMKGLLGQ